MDDQTSTIETPDLVRPRLSLGQRIATWWAVSTEIHELTRDRGREERVRAEAAVRLAPGPWAVADLFRRRR